MHIILSINNAHMYINISSRTDRSSSNLISATIRRRPDSDLTCFLSWPGEYERYNESQTKDNIVNCISLNFVFIFAGNTIREQVRNKIHKKILLFLLAVIYNLLFTVNGKKNLGWMFWISEKGYCYWIKAMRIFKVTEYW
jgi:hypothetical protein